MTAVLQGPLETGMERDQVGHRDYSISWLVITDDPNDGPTTLMATPGLPTIGSPWFFGNDSDPWALCWPNFTFTPIVTKEPNYWWVVGQKFTTRPIQRCQDITNTASSAAAACGRSHPSQFHPDGWGALTVPAFAGTAGAEASAAMRSFASSMNCTAARRSSAQMEHSK